MNCTTIQRRLLAAEQPDHPAAEVKSHLAECPACRAWHRRLVQLERHIPLLPVPPSEGKAELLHHLLRAGARETLPPTLRWATAGPKERGLRKLSLAFAMAAALLLFALGWWAWPHNSIGPTSPPTDPDRGRIEKVLATAKTPEERVLKLADLAEEVHREALGLTHDADGLERKARLYARLVNYYLLPNAQEVPPAERKKILPGIAHRLTEMNSQALRKVPEVDPDTAEHLRRIATAARGGQRSLLALTEAAA